MNKTVVIPAKMSGTGSIYDIASQHFDREIEFPEGHKYAVVLASYYGNGALYTTHETAEDAIEKSMEDNEFSHVIMDDEGNRYAIAPNGYRLQLTA